MADDSHTIMLDGTYGPGTMSKVVVFTRIPNSDEVREEEFIIPYLFLDLGQNRYDAGDEFIRGIPNRKPNEAETRRSERVGAVMQDLSCRGLGAARGNSSRGRPTAPRRSRDYLELADRGGRHAIGQQGAILARTGIYRPSRCRQGRRPRAIRRYPENA